ncbi:MAG: sodium:proton antiporter [Phycisphaeraceae bacterium]
MTVILAICVAVIFAVSIYMLLGGELKGIAMGVFLLGHAANLSILAMSGSPVVESPEPPGVTSKAPPLLSGEHAAAEPLAAMADPLPQALILTAIVIGFAMMGFLLSLIVVTGRSTKTLDVDDLAHEPMEKPAAAH